MPPPDDPGRLRDMLDAARIATGLCEGRERSEIHENTMLGLSCVRLLEIAGEAASRISPELRDANPTIDWRSIIALRNRLIHAYTDVDLDVVWNILVDDLPPPIRELEKLVEDAGE